MITVIVCSKLIESVLRCVMLMRNNNLLLRKLNDVGADGVAATCVSNVLSRRRRRRRRRANELPSADKICRAIERVFA